MTEVGIEGVKTCFTLDSLSCAALCSQGSNLLVLVLVLVLALSRLLSATVAAEAPQHHVAAAASRNGGKHHKLTDGT